MAVIHKTSVKPTKMELLSPWLPAQPWYAGSPGEPELAKAGGFRLDDPHGAVGIEFMVVTDTSGTLPNAYLVPLTYRGAPLDGAEHALVGTMEHGVLGPRWAYDGCHDPVLVGQLLALIEGRVQAQDQNISDTPDREVTRSFTGEAPDLGNFAVPAISDREATELRLPHGRALRLHRVLRHAPDSAAVLPAEATGHVAGSWRMPDGTRARGLFVVLHAGRT
jgi:hypothetical protein